MDNQQVLTVSQVAELCSVTTRTVQRWIQEGYFPGARKGPGRNSRYSVPQGDVDAFIARMSPQPLPGKDGTQTTTLPAGKAAEPHAVLATLAEMLRSFKGRPARRRLALIVEDDFAAGDIFELTLEAAGFTPVLLKSGRDAIQYLSAMVPDIIILDLHLPDVGGVEVLHYVRSVPELAQVPVIVATAHPQMAQDIQDDADLVLIKPVRHRVLQNKAIELTQARREKRIVSNTSGPKRD